MCTHLIDGEGSAYASVVSRLPFETHVLSVSVWRLYTVLCVLLSVKENTAKGKRGNYVQLDNIIKKKVGILRKGHKLLKL